MKPFVSIIIPTYHDWQRLSICIHALSNQSYPKSLFEVIIINNDPLDLPPEEYYLSENCALIPEEKPGSYAARNTGVYMAKGEIIGFTDSDCMPDMNWIKSAVDCFQTNKEISRIAGNIEFIFSGKNLTPAEVYEKVFSFRQFDDANSGTSVTANMFTLKKVFSEVGLFHDGMFSGGDIEWGLRANEKGFKIIYSKNTIVKHPARKLSVLLKRAKRISGGKYQLSSRKTNLLKYPFFAFAYELKPSFRKWRNQISSIPGLTNYQKVQAFFIRYLIKVVSAYEKLKIHNGEPLRRA